MDKEKLEHFKGRLLEEKRDVLNTLDLMNENEPNDAQREYFSELSAYDNHPADLGTETFMMEQMMNLKTEEVQRLREIDISLSKIEDGTYGLCDICGKEIDEERLEILPDAKICMKCAEEKIPIDELMDYRPIEEDNLEFPFGRSFKDISQEDVVEFDGEDSWQSVARYNEIPNDPSHNTLDHLGDFDDREPGIVEEVEQISEEYYKGQLEGLNREDIPDRQRKDKK